MLVDRLDATKHSIMRMKVYTASKLSDAPLWRRLRDDWPEVTFTARWPVCHVGTVPDTACFAKIFWQHDVEDVSASDVVVVYTESSINHLRGALIEVGIALALSKEVIVVGDHPDYGTWQYHKSVHRVNDLLQARQLLQTMALVLP